MESLAGAEEYHAERRPDAVSGGAREEGTCVCSLIVVPPLASCLLPPRGSLSSPPSELPPSSEREALVTRRGVATSVGASSSFTGSETSSGGVSVSSPRPCTMVWSAPLLTDI